MSWHYQIRKRTDKGQALYDIVEIYIKPKRGWTINSQAPQGETRAEVIRDLEMMLRDAKRYRTLVEIETR